MQPLTLSDLVATTEVQMGYRRLLKDYMRHIESAIGSDFVELASLTNALGKREIGELRALAAELRRESFTSTPSNNYNHLVHELLAEGRITLDQLDSIEGIEPATDSEDLPEEVFRRILLTITDLADSSDYHSSP